MASRSTPELVLGDTLELLRILWSVYHGLQETSKRMSRMYGITGSERIAIRLIGRFPGIPAGKLAEVLHVDPSTLTAVLKRLEKRGLVDRKRDSKDGRRVLLKLTRAGSKYDVEASGTAEAAVQRALRRHSARETAIATAFLLTVSSELDSPANVPRRRRSK